MRTIIAGSRDIVNKELGFAIIQSCPWKITEIISGCAKGVDFLGMLYANHNNIALKEFPADWAKYGKSAGFIRNKEMADNADALIAITNGSRGTAHMINIAIEKGLKMYVHHISYTEAKK
jgi:hypothetical protein